MRNGKWAAVAAIALAAQAAACNQGARGAGKGGADAPAKGDARARADSAQSEQKALRDSGVSVDTQTIDTGSVTAPPAEDN
ncbi:MAG TPA: hypothetical protein VEX86_03395 [Longimicrobium sp.]|nr:hypothetical protein [Longimicrobium sp.]